MGKCDDTKKKGIEKLNIAYNPLIEQTAIIIKNLTDNGQDPANHYDPVRNVYVNWVQLAKDLNNAKQSGINDIIKKIDKECYEEHEAILQTVLDLAILIYTEGLSLILPKHFTHIDVREILEGNILGGENSVFNKVKDDVFKAVGIGENHEFVKIINTPGKAAKDVVNGVLKPLGIKL